MFRPLIRYVIPMEDLDSINSFSFAPWEKRVPIATDETATSQLANGAVRIALSSSAR